MNGLNIDVRGLARVIVGVSALLSAMAIPARAQVTCPGSDPIVLDCNGNGTDDYCDLAAGTSADADTSGIPDECDTTQCFNLWSGFEPAPPFATGTILDGLDTDADGSAWDNPRQSWSVVNQGCPSATGKAIKAVSQTPSPTELYPITSEYFRTVDGRLDCGAAVYTLTFDARTELPLDPRIDWRMTLRDAVHGADVILLHWASTRSSYPGVTTAQGGDGRGRILVQNPAGSPAFINTGFAIPTPTCYQIQVVLDNVSNTVTLSINGVQRVTVGRLEAGAARMDAFRVEQAANGQTTGNLSRLGLDNFELCTTGAAQTIPDPDCNLNCLADGIEPDCNNNDVPDDCDLAAGTSQDCDSNGTPDVCQTDCNSNGTGDECDIGAASLHWALRTSGPSPRLYHAMAYDNARDVTVLFGGFYYDGTDHYLSDTWEWDGNAWTLRSTSGPSPRYSHAMTYDSARGVTVLFGGYDGDYDGETWEWDGSVWTLRATTGPTPRFGDAMAYDSARGVVVLFGGYDSSYPYLNGETWEWDGSAWTLRATTGPSPRLNHAMSYDSARGVVVLFGGYDNGTRSGETWEWDGSAWTLRATTGPSPRLNHAMSYDSARDVTVLFGGFYYDGGSHYLSDTWEWDGSAWTLRATSGPSPRYSHAMAYDRARGVVVLFGGYDGSYYSETWELRSASLDCNANGIPDECDIAAGTGQDCTGDGTLDECQQDCNQNGVADPCDLAAGTSFDVIGEGGNGDGVPDECQADCNMNLVPDPIDVAGGDCNLNGMPDECDISAGTSQDCTGDGTPDECQTDCNSNGIADGCDVAAGTSQDCNTNGTPDECDIGAASLTWTQQAAGGPSPRSAHALAYDSARGVTVLFGGYDAYFYLSGDTWEWDGSAWTLRVTVAPSPRDNHAMAYDSARGVTVLFGGYDGAYDGETWEWNASAWTLRATGGPSPRDKHAMAYDSARGVTVLFGGDDGSQSGETWEWDGSAWTLRATSGPSPRHGHTLAYDSARAVTVLFGGYYNDGSPHFLSDTWEWDGSAWTPRATTGPSPRYSHAMAYDSARGMTVLFGGYAGGYNGETWDWDGSAWHLRSRSGPAPRVGHAMAYDRGRGEVVLFGGLNCPYGEDEGYGHLQGCLGHGCSSGYGYYYCFGLGDTWGLKPASSDCNANGIPDECDISSGTSQDCTADGIPDECEPDCNTNGTADSCDIASGTSLDLGGPSGCGANGMPDECEADCNANRIPDGCDIASGTSGDCNLNGRPDECDLAEGTSQDCGGDDTPDECQPDCNINGVEDSCDLAAGTSQDCNTNGTPDECDTGAASSHWTLRDTGGPSPRAGHALAYDSARGVVVLFGGYDGARDGETWEWDGSTWTLRAGTGPSPRSGHSMAYDSARGVTVLFGGYDGSYDGETWEWDGSAWILRAGTGPSPRSGHAMAYDSARDVAALFGGYDGANDGETWEWNGGAWTLRAITGPSPRYWHGMAFDSARGVTVLFGGYDGSYHGETWEWDGSAWTLRAGAGPSPRYAPALAYDSARGVTVLFGGAASLGPNGETWAWDGDTWTQRLVVGPSSQYGHGMVYDTALGEVVLFGVRVSVGETWALRPASLDCNFDGVPDECEGDCNSNGVPDECDIARGTSTDGNGDGVPDECEGGIPAATILSVVSRKVHQPPPPLANCDIPVNVAGRVADGTVTSEPRIGGITELRITFDRPPGPATPNSVTILQQTGCPPGAEAAFAPYNGVSMRGASLEGNTLVLTFQPGLENTRTYRFDLSSSITSAANQSIEVRRLYGDVTGDGRVNAADRSAVVGIWTGPGFSCKTDVSVDSVTNASDRSAVVGAWSGGPTTNCAP